MKSNLLTSLIVIPAKACPTIRLTGGAGIQRNSVWMPAYAGITVIIFFLLLTPGILFAEEAEQEKSSATDILLDDKLLIDRYSEKYADDSQETIFAMIEDDSLGPYKKAAALRVLKERIIPEAISREKVLIERLLLRCLNRTDSAFVELEAMDSLVLLDRYKYFKSLVPAMIRKLDHYNEAVSTMAFENLQKTLDNNANRAREAKIVFSTLRKVLFLSRNRLQHVKEPSEKLKQKLTLLRWSIKVLGTQTLDQLPPEVIRLL